MDDHERDLGATTAGVWTTGAARAAGLTRAQVRRRIEQGEWQVVRRGVYADGGVVPGALMRASAAVQRAGHDAVAAGRTALRVWGVPLVDDEDPATGRLERPHDDVAVAHGRGAGPTLHPCELRIPSYDIRVVSGVRVLSPVAALVDGARVLRPDALVAAIDSALFRGAVTLDELQQALVGRRGWPGAPALRTAVALCDPRAESPHETLTRLVVRPHLPGLESQVQVFDRRGELLARLDLGERALRLGVESDGGAYHRGTAARDRARDARTGWTVERVSWFETRRRPAQLVARVLRTAERLGREQAA